MNFTALRKLLADRGVSYINDEPMKKHTTFCIGGPTRIFCQPQDELQLVWALEQARALDISVFLLGQGSNVLFCDEGFEGMVLDTTTALNSLSIDDQGIYAGAGAALFEVCVAARDASLAGLEFAYGIPGSVGGAIFMNAGAFGGEMRDVLQEVRCLDENGAEHLLPAAKLELGYRQSVFQHGGWCILGARISLQRGESSDIARVMRENMQRRADKQPLEMPSAGSAFKRPDGAFAGALIDQCGLRGYRVGGAAISEKHCGFIVNLGGATCRDVLAVADHAAQVVQQRTGYVLEKEIRVVGP